jgi:(2S)-methylsuccinyl-CoA dehydrogenase
MNQKMAKTVLDAAQVLVDKITGHLAKVCSGAKGVDIDKLDEHQIAAVDYTTMCSELAAAKAALESLAVAQAAGQNVELEETLTQIFIGETVHNIFGSVYKRMDEYGLALADMQAFEKSPELMCFVGEAQSAKMYEKAGDLILSTRTLGTDSWLSEQHSMFRDTFRKFAESEVRPLAEKVHRHDHLIPESIIKGLAEMGCFGLSLPQMYGGFQDDAKPDNIGMVVVTEELSRGSLGIAGSLITRPEILSKALLKFPIKVANGSFISPEIPVPKIASIIMS